MAEIKIENFNRLVESLRKYRRADLVDDENKKNIIEDLYTDPLEGDHVLKTLLAPHTTILIGRKGTGKSTIINRFQHEIRKCNDKISLYIDVKTIFDQARGLVKPNSSLDNILSHEDATKYLMNKSFLEKVLDGVKNEIKKDIFASNRFTKVFSEKKYTKEEFEKEIDDLFRAVSKPKFHDITAIQEIKYENGKSNNLKSTSDIGGAIKPDKVSISVSETSEVSEAHLNNEQFSSVFQRYFGVIEFMNKLKALLREVGIERVFICLDDASEIDKDSLEVFIKSLIAPLNNLADEYFKFKIAFYPGRDRLPDIDRSKIDILELDYYNLYSRTGVGQIEESAILCTKRLLEKRFEYFFGSNVDMGDFFETTRLSLKDYYKILFQISTNIPRVIGKILWYSSKKSINYGKKINKKILQEAAREYYEKEIEVMVTKNEYLEFKDYDEQSSRQHLKKLLNKIIDKARSNKKQIGSSESEIFKKYTSNTAPSDYMFIPVNLEKLISTLEFNFFISKYSQQKDKDTKEISIFRLNYGLCQKEDIIVDENSDRKFRIERLFDYTKLLQDWASSSESIICSNCKAEYDIDELSMIEKFGMMCPKCKQVACEVKKIKIDINVTSKKDLSKIPEKDFLILNALNIESPQNATQLAEELDINHQLVGRRCGERMILKTNNLVDRKNEKKEGDNQKRHYYYLTDKAKGIYFSN